MASRRPPPQGASRLRAELAARDAEIRGLRARLDEAERVSAHKSRLIGHVSHEFRTPLSSIIGFSTLLEREGESLGAETRAEYRGIVLRNAKHLLHVVNDLLNISKVEAGSLEVTLVPLRPAEVAANVVTALEPQARARSIAVHLENAAEKAALADSGRLRQVLINLLENAIKYSPEGGEVRVRTLDDGREVRVEVADGGPGILPEDQARLFKEFSRVNRPGVRVRGAGLGLALSRMLAEAMGGRIGVRSEPGRGSTFWVALRASGAAVPSGGESGGFGGLASPDAVVAGSASGGSIGSDGSTQSSEAVGSTGSIGSSGSIGSMESAGSIGSSGSIGSTESSGSTESAASTGSAGSFESTGTAEADDAHGSSGVSGSARLSSVAGAADASGFGISSGSSDPATTSSDGSADVAARTRTETVVVVEDDPDIRAYAVTVLARAGYRATGDDGAAGAGLRLAALRPALVLLDRNLDGRAGDDVLKELRAFPDLNAVPVLAFDAGGPGEPVRDGYAGRIAKPVEPGVLLARVDAALDEVAKSAAALPVEDEADYLAPLRAKFRAGLRDRLAAIESARAAGDGEALRREVHKLRGASAGYGYDELARVSEAAEEAIHAGSGEAAVGALVRHLRSLVPG